MDCRSQAGSERGSLAQSAPKELGLPHGTDSTIAASLLARLQVFSEICHRMGIYFGRIWRDHDGRQILWFCNAADELARKAKFVNKTFLQLET